MLLGLAPSCLARRERLGRATKLGGLTLEPAELPAHEAKHGKQPSRRAANGGDAEDRRGREGIIVQGPQSSNPVPTIATAVTPNSDLGRLVEKNPSTVASERHRFIIQGKGALLVANGIPSRLTRAEDGRQALGAPTLRRRPEAGPVQAELIGDSRGARRRAFGFSSCLANSSQRSARLNSFCCRSASTARCATCRSSAMCPLHSSVSDISAPVSHFLTMRRTPTLPAYLGEVRAAAS